MEGAPKRSTLGLAVLALLGEAPMHAYQMQYLIKQRGKDRVVNVRDRTNIYQVVRRLERLGLVTPVETDQPTNRPERNVYAITDSGLRICQAWERELLAHPTEEFADFPASLAFLPVVSPDDALRALKDRLASLSDQLHRSEAELAAFRPKIPRLFLLEAEYATAHLKTEARWVRSLIDDLIAGRITWSETWLREIAFPKPDEKTSMNSNATRQRKRRTRASSR